MPIWLRILGHLLRARLYLFLCYTNVNWRTCEECLRWHGRIVADPQEFPAHNSCPHELLRFPVWRLRRFAQEAARMRQRAQAELHRRALFRQAVDTLAANPEASVKLFEQAGQVDVYLPELERLASEKSELLRDSELRARLREVFLRQWKAKFARERYERQPEGARTAQEAWGVARIKELFA